MTRADGAPSDFIDANGLSKLLAHEFGMPRQLRIVAQRGLDPLAVTATKRTAAYHGSKVSISAVFDAPQALRS